MRIQHNITAMNSYRNYTGNTRAVAKNLEKLSSGYRINRAGDDAAGLAISEKMRAQIAGLEQAQTNAKSGINLVQTAEGAMTEIHDMLNRMVTLAEQSANGTYDDTVDRAQLQKEMASLKSEINRIADSANYNGIKLLDGSLDGQTKVNNDTLRGLNGMYITSHNWSPLEADLQLHRDAAVAAKTSFEVDLSGYSMIATTDNGIASRLDLWTKTNGGSVDITAPNTAGQTLQFKIDVPNGQEVDGADIAKAVYDSLKADDYKVTLNVPFKDAGGDTNTVGVEYQVEAIGDKLRFTMTDKGFKDAQTADNTNAYGDKDIGNVFKGSFNFGIMAPESNGVPPTLTGAVGDYINGNGTATSNIVEGRADAGVQLAEVGFSYDQTYSPDIKDGAGVKIGTEYYIWAGSDKTLNANYASNVHVVDIRDLVTSTGNLRTDANNTLGDTDPHTKVTEALSRLTEAAAGNDMFIVQLSDLGDRLVFSERPTYSGGADLATKNGILKELMTFDSINSKIAIKGKALTLQIGDTSESFNQMAVNVEDMHCKAMGIGDIDISTQEGAATAVTKIKNAVNYVSNTRGTMGALQNRLDHTINNLGVIQENIQDAESTIRDVDIAKEMMAYTKNSILVQSAQAMLTQANQLPQGVLQMLQG